MLEKTPPLSGPWLSETLAALFSCFHQLPGDLVTRKAQRNAHKRDSSIHKQEAFHVFIVFLLTAEECL